MYAIDFLMLQRQLTHYGTERVFRRFPEEAYHWKPEKATYTAGEMLFHLVSVNCHIINHIRRALGHQVEFQEMEPLGSFEKELKRFRELFYEHQDFLKTLTAEDFDKPVPYPEGGETSVGELLHTLVAHEVHHRGQAHLYLLLYGLKQPQLWNY